jgi:hypothetical protein
MGIMNKEQGIRNIEGREKRERMQGLKTVGLSL